MADPQLTLARLDADHANFRAALLWADEQGAIETLLRLVAGLEVYWCLRGHLREGRGWLERALAVSAEAPAPLRAAAFLAAGWVAHDQGDLASADSLGQQSRTLFLALGETPARAEALILLGNVTSARGDFAQAQALFEEALGLLDPVSEPFWRAITMRHLGWLSYLWGDTEVGERQLMETLALCQREGNRFVAVKVLSNLGTIALARGEHAQAAAHWRDRLELSWDARGLLWSLEGLAAVATAEGEHHRAARLWGAAEACRERLDIAMLPGQVGEYEAAIAAVRVALGELDFAAAWREGRQLSAEAARAEAEQVARVPAPPANGSDTASSIVDSRLTRREREVLHLLAAGRTDPQIAAALFITPRTARAHVASILAKLGVPTRAAAASHAVRQHLV